MKKIGRLESVRTRAENPARIQRQNKGGSLNASVPSVNVREEYGRGRGRWRQACRTQESTQLTGLAMERNGFVLALASRVQFRGYLASAYLSSPKSEMSHKMEIPKWQGCVESEVMAPPEIVWKTVSDFYEIQKWFPGMKSCERVEGVPEKGVGFVRCCVTDLPTDEKGSGSYAVEELIAQDDVKNFYTFRITDTDRPSFQGYEGTFALCETGEHGNCLFKWSFQMNPIEGRSKDETEGIMKSILAPIVSNLEKLASSQ